MYRKLMKYEFGATARIFLPLLGLLVLFTGTSAIGMSRRPEVGASSFLSTVQTISLILFAITAIVLAGSVLVITIQRVRRTMLGDEGYLTFTLPVSVDQVLWSKLTVSAFWYVVSGILGAACVYLMIRVGDPEAAPTVGQLFQLVRESNAFTVKEFGYSLYLMLAQWGLTAVISVFSTLITIFFCLSVGHLVRKGQLVLAIGVYFVINNVTSFFIPVRQIVNAAENTQNFMHFLFTAWGIITVEILVLAVILYIGTRLILTKRLNLQ